MGEGEATPLPESVKITEKNKKRDGRSAQVNKLTVLEHMDRVSHDLPLRFKCKALIILLLL